MKPESTNPSQETWQSAGRSIGVAFLVAAFIAWLVGCAIDMNAINGQELHLVTVLCLAAVAEARWKLSC